MNSQQRDAEADLKICEAATPGPWQTDDEIFEDLEGNCCWGVVTSGGAPVTSSCEKIATVEPTPDMAFVAMSREALPWWIARAGELQMQADALRSEIESLRAQQARQEQDLLLIELIAAWQAGEISEAMLCSMSGLSVDSLRAILHEIISPRARARWDRWRQGNPPSIPAKEAGGK